MKEKDNVKCKEWERRRRGKLNDAFKNLSQLLPNHDPAKNLPKIDILERSTEFVKELRLSNSRLLSQQSKTDEKCKLITQLQDEVNKLIIRVKQLTILLKQASIPIPLGPSIKPLGKKRHKWSNKLPPPDNLENSSTTPSSIPSNNSYKVIGSNASSGESNISTAVPLKEPNVTLTCSSSNEKESPIPPTVTLTSVTNNTTLPTTTTSPSILIVPEIPKTTTATLQLPMQTIYLTSCPMTPVINQSSAQVLTRIALGPTRLLPKPLDGSSPFLQKIAILPIRKPLPPKEKKRRKRKKKLPVVVPVVVSVEAEVQTKTDDLIENVPQNSISVNEKVAENEITSKESSSKDLEKVDSSSSNKSDIKTALKSKGDEKISEDPASQSQSLFTSIISTEASQHNENKTQIDNIMEVEFGVAQEVEISTNTDTTVPQNSTLGEKTIDKQSLQLLAVESNEMEVDSSQTTENTREIKESEKAGNAVQNKTSETSSQKTEETTKQSELVKEIPQPQQEEITTINTTNQLGMDISEDTFDHSNIDLIPSLNQDINESVGDAVTDDKISECIARSIDLIDAPDGELMELAENWGESDHSPKTPISPTQIFLNMFPLSLPRESIVAGSEGSQQGMCQTKSSQGHFHRSFFIDSMLPEDNPPNSNIPLSMNSNNIISSSLEIIPPSFVQASISRLTEMHAPSSSVPTIPSILNISVSKDSTLTSSPTCNTSKSSKNTNETKTSSRQGTGTKTSKTPQSSIKELSLFSEPLDFGTFPPITVSQIPFSEDLFRDTSRNNRYAPPECQLHSASVTNNQSGYTQLDFTNHFQNMHQPRQTQTEFNRFDNLLNVSINHQQQFSTSTEPIMQSLPTISHSNPPKTQQYPFQTSSNILENNFNQHQPAHSHSHNRDSTNTASNINVNTSQSQTNRGNFPYTVDYNLRHQPYNETPPASTKQSHSQSQATQVSQKNQLFRPQVRDSHPPVYHNLQHSSSTSIPIKSSTSCKTIPNKQTPTSGQRSENSASKRPEPQVSQDSSNHCEQIHNVRTSQPPQTPVTNLPKQSYFSHIQTSIQPTVTAQHNNHPPRNTSVQVEKPVHNPPLQSRNCQKKSVTPSEHTNVFPKTQSKEQNSSNTTTSKRSTTSTTTCQSRRNHDTSKTAENLLNVPVQHTPSHSGQLPRRSEPLSTQISHAITSFPDFSHSMNFNQHYENYNNSNVNYSSSTNTQIQPPPQQQRHGQQAKTSSSRPTPFYLQDVSPQCETFNFLPHSSVPNPNQHHQHQQISIQPNYNNNSKQQSQQYTAHLSPNIISNPNTNNAQHPQYFPSAHTQPVQNPLLSSTITCQQQAGNYPHPSQPVRQSSSSTNSTRTIQQTPHNNSINSMHTNVNVAENPLAYNPNLNLNQHSQKSKPPTSSVSQSNYANQNQPGSNNDTVNPSNTSSSRPVNWMTDTPYRNNNKSNPSTVGGPSTTSTTVSNPFSVSKLVGNNNAQPQPPNNNSNNAPITSSGSNNNNRPNNCTNIANVNTSYCAEALIRKNPNISTNNSANNTNWNNLNFTSTPQSQNQHHSQSSSSQSQPNNNNNSNNNQQCNTYHTSNNQFNFQGYNTTNFQQHSNSHHYVPTNTNTNPNPSGHVGNTFSQFGPVVPNASSNNNNQQQVGVAHQGHQQQQYNFNHHPHSQNQNLHHHGTTSSVSNFNLSSIFPEINDKRHNSTGSNNHGHASSGGGVNNTSNNNCGYYPQQQTGHANNK